MQRRRVLMGMQSELPGAYRRVEYLETDGNQYIIGIPFTFNGNDISFRCMYKIYQLGTYAPHIFSAGQQTFWLVNRSGAAIKSLFQINGGTYGYPDMVPTNTKLVAEIEDGYGTIAGLGEPIRTLKPNASSLTCALFAYVYTPSSSIYRAPMAIYELSLACKDGDRLNLVPCVRKSDSKPGMYDTVTKTFYTNAGTGEFIIPA